MKILHLYKDYYPVIGGIENHVRLLAEGQVARGHEVEILVTNSSFKSQQQMLNGVKVTKIGRWAHFASTPLTPLYPLHLYRCLLSSPPDIIHLQMPYPLSEVSWLVASIFKSKTRCVITYQSDVVKQKNIMRFYAPIMRRVLKSADVIIATSPNYIQTSAFLKPFEPKCRVIPLGIYNEPYHHSDPAQVAQIKARYNTPLILFVGRLRYYKGLNYLIQSMLEVPPPAHLLIIGRDGVENALHTQCRDLGLDSRVTFLPDISDADLPAYYNACDIFVLPSAERSEAFGLVLVEAMASGKAVISAELGTGTSYVNQDGITGLVVPPADATALAGACNYLLTNPILRQRLGAQGRERALVEFSAEMLLNRIMTIYEDILKTS